MINTTEGFGMIEKVMTAGNADWLRNVAIPLLDEFKDLPHFDGEYPAAYKQRHARSEATNSFFGFAVAGISFYALKKVADDFYDVKIKPRVRRVFEAVDKDLTSVNNKAKKILIVSVWYEQYDLVVSVSVVGYDFDKIVDQLDQVGMVQRKALADVAATGVLAPVYHYKIEDGNVNTKPEHLQCVEELMFRG